MDLLHYEFMQRALIAAVLVGLAAPSVGVYLVQRRLSLIGDGLGHVALAGVAAGVLTSTEPVWTALAAAVAGAVYTVSHAHYCTPVGGFPQSDPWAINMRRALAFTVGATGTNNHDEHGYYDWYGAPAPSMLNWFPEVDAGSFTGKTQGAWSVSGNDEYVVLGGEFPRVNGRAPVKVRSGVPGSLVGDTWL